MAVIPRFADELDLPTIEDNAEYLLLVEYRERLRQDPADARDWLKRQRR